MSLKSLKLRKRIVVLAVLFIFISAFSSFYTPVTAYASATRNEDSSSEGEDETKQKEKGKLDPSQIPTQDDGSGKYNGSSMDAINDMKAKEAEEGDLIINIEYTDDTASEDDDGKSNPVGDYLKSVVANTIEAILDKTGPTAYVNIMLGRESGFYDTVMNLGKNLGTLLKAFAASFLLMYVLEEVIKEATKAGEITDVQIIYKPLIKLSVGLILLIYIDDILLGVETLGVMFVEYMEKQSALAIAEQSIGTLKINLSELGLLDYIAALPRILSYSLFYQPLAWILKISVKTISYALFFELAVRKVFMPLAIVNIVSSPSSGSTPGIRFLKRYFAIYVRMAIIVVTVVIVNALLMTTVSRINSLESFGRFDYMFYDFFCLRTAGLAVMRAGSKYADDIMGVK